MNSTRVKGLVNSYGPQIVERMGVLLNPFLLNFKNEKNRLLVFYFHGLYVSEKEKKLNHIDPQNNMTVTQFEEFINYFLKNNYKFICPEDISKDLDSSKQYAMITFDDGYSNNLLACEIMEKYEIPAVFFLTTGNIADNNSYWWDIIFKFRSKQGSSLENIRSEQVSLKCLKHQNIIDYIVRNFGIASLNPWSDIDRPLNEAEVKLLANNQYTSIGNHTHNHSILTNYSRDEIVEELRSSNKSIFDMTGEYPVSIAYPNGNFNDLVISTVKEEGFKFAFTIQHNPILLPVNNINLLSLNRFMASTEKINNYGSFYRMGYIPNYFFFSMKDRLTSVIKRKK
jgi:peptidoglycan/xylan/chitin deacetylase (PgdA/CDA1 family)